MKPDDLVKEVYRKRGRHLVDINKVSPWHRVYREHTWKKIAAMLPSEPGMVLDACCGPGIFVEKLLELGHFVVAVDMTPEVIHTLKSRLQQSQFSTRLRAECCDIHDINRFFGQEFEVVLCTQAMNFMPSLASLSCFAQVIKPSGRMFLDIDTCHRWAVLEVLSGRIDNAMAILTDNKDRERRIVGTEYYFHAIEDVRHELCEAGFQIDCAYGHQFATPFVHAYAESQDFLYPASLSKQARPFCDTKTVCELLEFETAASQCFPAEIGAWYQCECTKAV